LLNAHTHCDGCDGVRTVPVVVVSESGAVTREQSIVATSRRGTAPKWRFHSKLSPPPLGWDEPHRGVSGAAYDSYDTAGPTSGAESSPDPPATSRSWSSA